jgi:hypothetical protein
MADPAPSGWSLPRLRIDREGVWFAEDGEVTHGGIVANLWSNLRVDTEGHFLQVGPLRIPVEVEDAPFVVLRVEREGQGLTLTLNDLSREPLRPETLRLGAGEVPYCRVREERFEARFSRAAAYELLELVEYDEASGRGTLALGGRRYALERRDRA